MYKIEKRLGSGAFGDVYLLQLGTGEKYALKVADTSKFMKDENMQAESVAEARLMLKLCHPHLVQCCAFFSNGRYLYLFLEFCSGGTLKDYLKKRKKFVSEIRILQWLAELADGLRYLHVKNVIHRDLKLDNIFLDEGRSIKIGDLGIARELAFTQQVAETVIGTYSYMSPEIFHGLGYTAKTDIWSLGCCTHELMTLEQTFSGHSLGEIFNRVTTDPIPSVPSMYSTDLQQLVFQILNRDPQKRPDALEILFHVCQIQGQPYRSADYKPMEHAEVNQKMVYKAVKEFELSNAGSHHATGGDKHKDWRASKCDDSDSDDDCIVIPFERRNRKSPNKISPLPQSHTKVHPRVQLFAELERQITEVEKTVTQKNESAQHVKSSFPVLSKKGKTRKKQLSSVREQKQPSGDFTPSSQLHKLNQNGNPSHFPSSDLTDTLDRSTKNGTASLNSQNVSQMGKGSIQWLKSKAVSDKQGKNGTADMKPSTNSESLVTLYTRAQVVKYSKREVQPQKVKSDTEQSNLMKDLACDVIEAAVSVIQLFTERNMQKLMLINVLGHRDFLIHGTTLRNKASQC